MCMDDTDFPVVKEKEPTMSYRLEDDTTMINWYPNRHEYNLSVRFL